MPNKQLTDEQKLRQMCAAAYSKEADTLTNEELFNFIKHFVRDAYTVGRELELDDIDAVKHITARYEYFDDFIDF